MSDRWRPVPGYEDLYEVCDCGQVRALPRLVRCVSRSGREFWRRHAGGLLAAVPTSSGYLAVKLCRSGVERTCFVHRLVLEAFAGGCPPGMQALHGPGGHLDNRWPENLSWGTPGENMADRERDGTTVRGSDHCRAKLTSPLVQEIRARYAAGGISQRALAAEFGVTQTQIWRVLADKSWRQA